MDFIAWNIAEILLPLTLLAFLSHQAGVKNRYSNLLAVRAVGSLLLGIGWLGYSLLAFLILIDLIAPLVAWSWTTFVH